MSTTAAFSINVKRPTRGKTEQTCTECGTRRLAAQMHPTRVPGVGCIYRCKRCPDGAKP